MTSFWISLLLLGFGITSMAEAASESLAEVDGIAITSEEVEKPLASQLSKLEEQIYNLKRQRLQSLINDKLLEKEAAKRKLPVSALLDAEVTAKVGLVTEQEIEKFYQDNKAQIKGEQAELREKIQGSRKKSWAQHISAFETCLASVKHQAAIKSDIAEGNRVGVSGTPAFFINGQMISGAQPLEAFTRIIDDELSRDVTAQSGGR